MQLYIYIMIVLPYLTCVDSNKLVIILGVILAITLLLLLALLTRYCCKRAAGAKGRDPYRRHDGGPCDYESSDGSSTYRLVVYVSYVWVRASFSIICYIPIDIKKVDKQLTHAMHVKDWYVNDTFIDKLTIWYQWFSCDCSASIANCYILYSIAYPLSLYRCIYHNKPIREYLLLFFYVDVGNLHIGSVEQLIHIIYTRNSSLRTI